MNKKAFLFLPFLTLPILLGLALVLAIVFGGTTLWLWMLKQTVLFLAGIVMLVFLGWALVKGRTFPWWLWAIATALILLPYLGAGKSWTLSALVG